MRTPAFVSLAGLVMALVTPLAAAPDRPKPLFPDDTRLSRPVNVARGRIYLGELIQEVSRQAKVPLQVEGDRGPVDGIDLTIYVQELPLRDLMSSLADLFSRRFDRWEW